MAVKEMYVLMVEKKRVVRPTSFGRYVPEEGMRLELEVYPYAVSESSDDLYDLGEELLKIYGRSNMSYKVLIAPVVDKKEAEGQQ